MSSKNEPTEVYGYSDDNIAFTGGLHGEVGCYGNDENERGVLVAMSDGTLLEVQYCGRVPGVWEIKLLQQGPLFERIDLCNDEDADPYSDVAHFKAGITTAYAATEYWDLVK